MDDPLFTECKLYEAVAARADVMFEAQAEANELVKNFIRERGLILYGGEAIDGAVRERGGELYASGTVPDYDFYTANSVEDAYDLADVLFEAGMEGARAIAGLHYGTMKVDAGENHFVADLSYIPHRLFEAIPTVTHDGLRRVHPGYQRADIHRAIAHPYIDPPREVIFHRLSKDVARFNLLEEYYPVSELAEFLGGTKSGTAPGATSNELPESLFDLPGSVFSRPITGILASRIYRGMCGGESASSGTGTGSPSKIPSVSVSLPVGLVERIATEIPRVDFGWFGDLLLDTHEEEISGVCVSTARTHGRLIPCQNMRVGGLIVPVVGVQYVLWWLIAHFWAIRANERTTRARASADIYLREYMALCSFVLENGSSRPELAPWLPSYYGDLNESMTEKISKARDAHARDPKNTRAPPQAPASYHPAKSAGRHPKWDNLTFEKLAH